MSLGEVLINAKKSLLEAGIHNASQELRWIVDYIKNQEYGNCHKLEESDFTPAEFVQFQKLISKRSQHYPLQYLLGSTEFYGVELTVGDGVLIPRPETERLVDYALEVITTPANICDLCTGSGAIPIALAKNISAEFAIYATDISAKALHYAQQNINNCQLTNLKLFQGNLFASLPSGIKFQLITANPPYISPADYATLPEEVKKYEPKLALYAEDLGMKILQQIANSAPHYLEKDGWIICEMSSEQGALAIELFMKNEFCNVEVLQDYTGRDRFIKAQWNKD